MRRVLVTAAALLLSALMLAPSAGAAGVRRELDYEWVSVEGRFTETWDHDEFANEQHQLHYEPCDWSAQVTTRYTLDRRHPGTAFLLFPGSGEPPHYEATHDLHFRITDSSVSTSACEKAGSCAGHARRGRAHIGAVGDGDPIRMAWDGVPTFEDPHFSCYDEWDPQLFIFASERRPRNYSISRLSANRVTFTIQGADSRSETHYYEPGSIFGFRETTQANWQWTIELHRRGGLTADAGGPYTVERGDRLRLDGSRSGPRERIDSYRWTFEPTERAEPQVPPVVNTQNPARAAQDAGCKPDHGGKKGKTTTIIPLCTIKATLTVTDGGETDSDTTTIKVKPRNWKTPVKPSTRERYTKWGQPRPGSADGSTFGLNVPGCPGAARFVRDSYFCPLPEGDSWFGEAYALDIVDDPKGPFNNYWWVKSQPKFEIQRRELVNAYLYPGAGVPEGSSAPEEFYAANKEEGFPIDDFIHYVENHEGAGQGQPRSGHTQAIVDLIRDKPDANDPRRAIESVVEKTERGATKEADKRLRAAGQRVCLATRDPLDGPWTGGNPFAWDPSFKKFSPLDGVDFEGNARDCAA